MVVATLWFCLKAKEWTRVAALPNKEKDSFLFFLVIVPYHYVWHNWEEQLIQGKFTHISGDFNPLFLMLKFSCGVQVCPQRQKIMSLRCFDLPSPSQSIWLAEDLWGPQAIWLAEEFWGPQALEYILPLGTPLKEACFICSNHIISIEWPAYTQDPLS